MARISAKARCWCAVAVVSNSKFGASALALGVRQVLHECGPLRHQGAKLCVGSSSSSNFEAALRCAKPERVAVDTGSGVALAACKQPRAYDKALDKLRPLVENAFLHLKRWRGIATRYAINVSSFVAAVQILCLALWLQVSRQPDLANMRWNTLRT